MCQVTSLSHTTAAFWCPLHRHSPSSSWLCLKCDRMWSAGHSTCVKCGSPTQPVTGMPSALAVLNSLHSCLYTVLVTLICCCFVLREGAAAAVAKQGTTCCPWARLSAILYKYGCVVCDLVAVWVFCVGFRSDHADQCRKCSKVHSHYLWSVL
jgi:hypothetical protein